jgi:hypothetical protein
LGIRQFYKLVGDAPIATNRTTSSSSSSSRATNPSSPDVDGADNSPTAAPAAEQTHTGHNGTASGSPSHTTDAPAAQQQQQQQPNSTAPDTDAEGPKLSLAEQEQLLMLKVDALLQLLSSVSFHQVRDPFVRQLFKKQACRSLVLMVRTQLRNAFTLQQRGMSAQRLPRV